MDVNTLKDSKRSKKISNDTKNQSCDDVNPRPEAKLTKTNRIEASSGSPLKDSKKISIVPLERLLAHPEKADEIKQKIRGSPLKNKENHNRDSRRQSSTQCSPVKLNGSDKKRLPGRKTCSTVVELSSTSSSSSSSSDESNEVKRVPLKTRTKRPPKYTFTSSSSSSSSNSGSDEHSDVEEVNRATKNTKKASQDKRAEKSVALKSKLDQTKTKRCVVRVKRIHWSSPNIDVNQKNQKEVARNSDDAKNAKVVEKQHHTGSPDSSDSADDNDKKVVEKRHHSESPDCSDSSDSSVLGNSKKATKSKATKAHSTMDSTTAALNSKRKRIISDTDSDFDIKKAAENAVNNFSDGNDEDEVAGKRAKKSGDSDSEVVTTRKRRAATMKKKVEVSDDSDFEPKAKAKKPPPTSSRKRRRIKNNDTSDSGSGDEDGDKKKNKNKRKQIHKIIRNEDLNIDTKTATKEEQERRKRIEERQKLYNQIYEKPESAEVTELVLDFDAESKKPLLVVDPGLLKKLKPHQVTGVKFMWEACYETLKDTKEGVGSGCILAHCMGLGKTLQVVTLSHTLLTNYRKTQVERILIISPLSTLNNWAREFKHWISFARKKDIEVYDMSRYKDKLTRIFNLHEWFREGGVCIMGYDMFRILSNEKAKGLRKRQREQLQEALVDPGPDLVVCDEGHLLKNEKTSISKAVTRMRSKRRIVLTGTPLQNNLKEYYCMIQFVKPNLLGTYKEYLNRFVNPITNGQYTDSTERDIRLMKHRSHILHKMLEGCIQRKDYSVLAPYLPPKHEYVVYTQLSEVQKELYEFYMTTQRELISSDISGKGARLFQDFQDLRRIWTHPMNLRVNSDTVIRKRILANDDDSMDDFICDEDDEEDEEGGGSKKKGNRGNEIEDSSDSNDSIDSTKSFPSEAGDELSELVGGPSNSRKTRSRKKANGGGDDVSDDEESSDLETQQATADQDDPSEWWKRFVEERELNNVNHSPKLLILMRLLQRCETIGDKVLVFSQSLQSLDVIEHFLKLVDTKTRGGEIDGDVGEFSGLWQPNVDYFRLDGSSSVDNRDDMCKRFNNPDNLRARLFLISTRAGGLGINLVAANRVVIFDVSWNPSHDTQSIFRVYRFGQEKPCYIYRLIAMGTMEQKVYERQVTKQATAKRVIDEQQISRHYNSSDLQELYSYELTPSNEREIPILPKDRLFAELLCDFEKLIFKYHEHDSLLENEESENLSEEERKAAWSEYEAEKTRATQAQQYISYDRGAFGNLYGNMASGGSQSGNVTSSRIFGFRSDVLLTLLNMKIGKDCPELNPNQIVQMVPNYLQRLYNEMNNGDPTMYKDLLQLHSTLQHPSGLHMSPLLYANQNPQAAGYQQKPAFGQQQSVIVNNSNTGIRPGEGAQAQTQALGFNSGEVYEID